MISVGKTSGETHAEKPVQGQHRASSWRADEVAEFLAIWLYTFLSKNTTSKEKLTSWLPLCLADTQNQGIAGQLRIGEEILNMKLGYFLCTTCFISIYIGALKQKWA